MLAIVPPRERDEDRDERRQGRVRDEHVAALEGLRTGPGSPKAQQVTVFDLELEVESLGHRREPRRHRAGRSTSPPRELGSPPQPFVRAAWCHGPALPAWRLTPGMFCVAKKIIGPRDQLFSLRALQGRVSL